LRLCDDAPISYKKVAVTCFKFIIGKVPGAPRKGRLRHIDLRDNTIPCVDMPRFQPCFSVIV